MNEGKNILKFDKLVYEVKNKDKEIHTEYARIINGLSGQVESGKITAVMGASGCGKTHFFELLIGNLASNCKTSGNITYNGKERDWKEWINKIAFLPQEDIFYQDLTLFESIMYNLSFNNATSYKENVEIANEAIAISNITNKKDAILKSLSGGERKRAMVAITLANNPEILILDEPTTGLDSSSALKIVASLKNYAEKNNKIVIMTVHQPGDGLYSYFGDLIFLTRGGLFYIGKADKIDEFLFENGIEPHGKYSTSEFLFLLHSNEEISAKCKNKLYDIEQKNTVREQLSEPDACNNNKVFFWNINLRHSYILFKHNLKLLYRSPGYKKTLTAYLLCVAYFSMQLMYSSFGKFANDFASLKKTPNFNLGTADKITLAYSFYTYFIILTVVVFTVVYNIHRQEHNIWNSEIFNGKYSVLSYYFYDIMQRFVASTFFLNFIFLILLLLNRNAYVPMIIILILYVFTLLSVLLLSIVHSLIAAYTFGPKMTTLLLVWHNVLVYLQHDSINLWIRNLLNSIDKSFLPYVMCIKFIYPSFLFDMYMNNLIRYRYLSAKLPFKLLKIYQNLKYDSSRSTLLNVADLFIQKMIFNNVNYTKDPHALLSIYIIKLKLSWLKYMIPINSVGLITLTIFLIVHFKVPNIRTNLKR
ncbi:hypothetical protein NCER_100318 [Vairimorpha ceranae BRL01]|uniref:ABC transporter domain-containing protein n=2 Tax=Vairimorpha ceranae TaxID=40302 RepID=C4V797_VAIC1|nr:abc transporter [Vairimorpha ceranae]EEQ82902.1 hypothetical protein NCER_100318 [Vairimorpha ceranae BRL01]KAF5139706.1 hypothetical protein G9O61_00g021290 [Vairimorpha ceranae]KAF5139919.1 hypothetical protein G9O61_00g019380 [Vairimorpha ceranae]KKO75277.1 abc transporter [Vairimorpha ceranae]